MGVPARVVRPLDDAAIAALRQSARHYTKNAARFRRDLKEI
jgi:carbonic anhydrase/acetyltransferase-like protein (isoleucine patch superfamily)